MEAIGSVDEANSAIGIAASATADSERRCALIRIQNDLFDLGADLATPGDEFVPSEMVLRIVPSQVAWLEDAIDAMNERLEPLASFILPGGAQAASHVHMARALVRRAERAMTSLASREPVNPAALAYINRLSDFLFVLARAINAADAGDVLWVPGKNR